ncbi:MAG: 2-phosphosulfolactate phosphatase [Chitinophagaceae bacterium]|nr:2-phosphosulfolactate phosphatase [Chitinophagaceae bacterium]
MSKETAEKPSLYTVLTPAVLSLYDLKKSVVVIIDILRATSTIATALHNGAREVIPVDSIAECIRISKQLDAISAGERDGKIAEGLEFGNTPFDYNRDFIEGKTLVLTTTNGTRLLHLALASGADEIITGSFCNFSSVVDYLRKQNKNVILACAAWRDKVNMEDTLYAGAVVQQLMSDFSVNCDSSHMAASLYELAKHDLLGFMKTQNASHYHRLMGFGAEEDLKYCFTLDNAGTLPVYRNGRLVASSPA